MDSRPSKRGALNQNGGPKAKKPRSDFASKMMAKMGYEKGQGLGKDGAGILNPIEVKLRPQGVGVGAVKEKTPQAKAEAKRAAERRGEEYEDSSGEERKARRKRHEAAKTSTTGQVTPLSRAKPKYRTATEIETEDGLKVPSVFKSLVDHTGRQPRLLTSTAGLMSAQSDDAEVNKIALRAQRELEHFASSWRELQDRKENSAIQVQQLTEELQQQEQDALDLRSMCDAVRSIKIPSSSITTEEELEAQFEELTTTLEQIQNKFMDAIQKFELSEVAVGAIQPLFKRFISLWDPLEDPLRILPYLDRLTPILGVNREDGPISDQDEILAYSQAKFSTPYETMIYTLWLPKVRSLVVNEWDPYDPTPLILLISSWKSLIPEVAYKVVVDQYIVQRLTDTIKSWKPHASGSNRGSTPEPHTWIFPWLEHVDEYHRDPKSSNGLLAELKRKFRTSFSTWDPSKGLLEGLDKWLEVKDLRGELKYAMDVNLLPRLARYLHDKFEVDPSDQDITPIEKVLAWAPFFSAEKLSRVFLDAFFPPWLNVLHLWLTSEPNYEEIGVWFEWWQSQFPAKISEVPAVAVEWDKGLRMINEALELGPERVKTELTAPAAGPQRPIVDAKSQAKKVAQATSVKPSAPVEDEVEFKDVVEDLCAEHNLSVFPLRKPHPETGRPLFKITASASPVGGVNVYFQGDVMWAQNRKDRNLWEPFDVYQDGLLASLAEGK